MTLASVLAELTLESLIWWLIIGLIAGFLASVVIAEWDWLWIVGDIVAGLIGAFIVAGSSACLASTSAMVAGSIIIAFVGACIFIGSSD